MHPRDHPIREAITSDVPCDEAVAIQSVHEFTSQAGHPLFLRVRPCPLVLPAIRAKPAERTNGHLLYSIFLFALLDVLGITGRLPTGGWQLVVLFLLEYLPMYTLTPRFIISIRKLYAHDARGRCVGGIDTGFGLSLDDHDIGGETAIMFADVEQNEVLEGVEEIPMEIGTNQAE